MKRNYDDPLYKEFRIRVLNRDKRTCQMPGCKKKTRLQVHHIRPWAKNPHSRYDVNNGITLCKDCHKYITRKEHIYADLFEEIIHG
jgi:5-methylcytosine-specific restriction endonuclease McrA